MADSYRLTFAKSRNIQGFSVTHSLSVTSHGFVCWTTALGNKTVLAKVFRNVCLIFISRISDLNYFFDTVDNPRGFYIFPNKTVDFEMAQLRVFLYGVWFYVLHELLGISDCISASGNAGELAKIKVSQMLFSTTNHLLSTQTKLIFLNH